MTNQEIIDRLKQIERENNVKTLLAVESGSRCSKKDTEDVFSSTRNGHTLVDFFDREANTLDIRSNGLYPSNVLSNLCSNAFEIDGIRCSSMEGFLQSLKREDPDKQREICSMKGGSARKKSVASWQTDQTVWWQGKAIDRQGRAYQDLLRRAYQAMFDQNEQFRVALMATGVSLYFIPPERPTLTRQSLHPRNSAQYLPKYARTMTSVIK